MIPAKVALQAGTLLVLAVTGFGGAAATAEEAKAKSTKSGTEIPAIETLKATWKFSSDQGRTYTLDSLPAQPGAKVATWGRVEFTVDDPARIGMLWFLPKADNSGITPVNSYVVGGRYIIMNLVLEEARLALNGKDLEPEIPNSNTLYLRWGIDPLQLKKGTNVIAFSGRSLIGADTNGPTSVEFRLATSPSDALDLRNGPVLGPIGEDYFTLACRTWIPCEIQVKVTPTEPSGPEKVFSFPRGTIHHARMALPAGTRKFKYTVVARNGELARSAETYEVRVPDPSMGLKFAVLGQTAANSGTAGLELARRKLLEADPDFIIHTGSFLIYAYWDMLWDSLFFAPLQDLFARKPICAVPAYKDCYSQQFACMLYYPTANGLWDNWVWTIGPVRFIGVDGLGVAENPDLAARWFEDALRNAKEDFIFDVTSYPAYTTNPFGRGQKGHDFDRNVLQPLLAKYKATASLGCTGKYEFIPATNAASVPTVITGGVGAPMAPGWLKHQYCIFTIKDGKCSYEAIAYETGEILDKRSFESRQTSR